MKWGFFPIGVRVYESSTAQVRFKRNSAMESLGDDELALILNLISDEQVRKSCSQVCKQWLRVEGQNRLSIRVVQPEFLPNLLPRFPNLVSFESSEPISDAHLRFLARTCPKIETLNLGLRKKEFVLDESRKISWFEDVGDDGLASIAAGCRNLSRVSLRRRRRVGDVAVVPLVRAATNLIELDLENCSRVSDKSLEAIGAAAAASIRVLNLKGCFFVTDLGLASLAGGPLSKCLRKLVLEECDQITDAGVAHLRQMRCLEELNLAECGPGVTDAGGLAIAAIPTLRCLNIGWLMNISDATLFAVAENCRELAVLDLTGCESITGNGVRSFSGRGSLETLILASCCNVYVHDVEALVLGCQSLRQMVLDKRMRAWKPVELQENISSFCRLIWVTSVF